MAWNYIRSCFFLARVPSFFYVPLSHQLPAGAGASFFSCKLPGTSAAPGVDWSQDGMRDKIDATFTTAVRWLHISAALSTCLMWALLSRGSLLVTACCVCRLWVCHVL